MSPCLAFYIGFVDQTHILLFVWQILYKRSYLPRPYFSLLNSRNQNARNRAGTGILILPPLAYPLHWSSLWGIKVCKIHGLGQFHCREPTLLLGMWLRVPMCRGQETFSWRALILDLFLWKFSFKLYWLVAFWLVMEEPAMVFCHVPLKPLFVIYFLWMCFLEKMATSYT